MDQTDYTKTVAVTEGGIPQFVEGAPAFLAKLPYLSDADYAQALRVFVISCVDLFVVCEGRVLLGKRQQEPQPDWWIIGGKMNPGESRTATAIRKAREELGVDLSGSVFEFLGSFDYAWSTSAQGGPCAVSATTYVVEVIREQADAIILNKEYAGMKWVEPMDVLLAGEGTYHPAIDQMFKIYDSGVYKTVAALLKSL